MHLAMGQHMTRIFSSIRGLQPRMTSALAFAGALLLASSFSPARAQSLGYAPAEQGAFPQGDEADAAAPQDEDGLLPDRLRRQVVNFDTREAPGTIVIDTGNTYLYYVL